MKKSNFGKIVYNTVNYITGVAFIVVPVVVIFAVMDYVVFGIISNFKTFNHEQKVF